MDQLRDIMVKKVITIDHAKNAQEASIAMAEHEIGSLVIVSDGTPVGIVTERDLVRKVCTKGVVSSKIPLADIMSSPVISAEPDMLIETAVQRMFNNKIRRLVIMEKGTLVGMVTVSDLAKYVRTRSLMDKMFD
ncbi:MAG: cyclic nucleotide-binding/CBS domain-containing protein [Nitrososphaerales archaeon]